VAEVLPPWPPLLPLAIAEAAALAEEEALLLPPTAIAGLCDTLSAEAVGASEGVVRGEVPRVSVGGAEAVGVQVALLLPPPPPPPMMPPLPPQDTVGVAEVVAGGLPVVHEDWLALLGAEPEADALGVAVGVPLPEGVGSGLLDALGDAPADLLALVEAVELKAGEGEGVAEGHLEGTQGDAEEEAPPVLVGVGEGEAIGLRVPEGHAVRVAVLVALASKVVVLRAVCEGEEEALLEAHELGLSEGLMLREELQLSEGVRLREGLGEGVPVAQPVAVPLEVFTALALRLALTVEDRERVQVGEAVEVAHRLPCREDECVAVGRKEVELLEDCEGQPEGLRVCSPDCVELGESVDEAVAGEEAEELGVTSCPSVCKKSSKSTRIVGIRVSALGCGADSAK
jgi:hypothetical protein